MMKNKILQKDKNPFPFSDSNKRYYSYDYFLRKKFGKKVCKLPLDIGCTCPNIDGTKSVGGCIYCSPRGSGDFAGQASEPIESQLSSAFGMMSAKWGDDIGCIPYFQAHTNTYGDPEYLSAMYRRALDFDGTVGISIATRADCLGDEIVGVLRELSKETFLTVELGLQSIHDSTADRINRAHSYGEFLRGYEKLCGLNVCVHIINGLPGEDHDMMTATAKEVAALHPHALKIHLLHVLEHTRLGEMYKQGDVGTLSLDEYVKIVCDQLELLPPDVVIGRVTGDGAPDDLIAPLWSRKKLVVMNEIDKELYRRGSMQSAKWKC